MVPGLRAPVLRVNEILFFNPAGSLNLLLSDFPSREFKNDFVRKPELLSFQLGKVDGNQKQ